MFRFAVYKQVPSKNCSALMVKMLVVTEMVSFNESLVNDLPSAMPSQVPVNESNAIDLEVIVFDTVALLTLPSFTFKLTTYVPAKSAVKVGLADVADVKAAVLPAGFEVSVQIGVESVQYHLAYFAVVAVGFAHVHCRCLAKAQFGQAVLGALTVRLGFLWRRVSLI